MNQAQLETAEAAVEEAQAIIREYIQAANSVNTKLALQTKLNNLVSEERELTRVGNQLLTHEYDAAAAGLAPAIQALEDGINRETAIKEIMDRVTQFVDFATELLN